MLALIDKGKPNETNIVVRSTIRIPPSGPIHNLPRQVASLVKRRSETGACRFRNGLQGSGRTSGGPAELPFRAFRLRLCLLFSLSDAENRPAKPFSRLHDRYYRDGSTRRRLSHFHRDAYPIEVVPTAGDQRLDQQQIAVTLHRGVHAGQPQAIP
jgi:hypothetical protein